MPVYAKITHATEFPFNGTAIFIQGKNISYESSNYSLRRIFPRFLHIKRIMMFRRDRRKSLKNMGFDISRDSIMLRMTSEIEMTMNEIKRLLRESGV